jgi:PPOX class probable F420-dependent enzyme
LLTVETRKKPRVAIPIPDAVRELLEAPNHVHLSTLRADGSPRNWVVWVGLEADQILVCTSDTVWKAKDMRRDPRVALSVSDMANPYRMASIQGRVIEVRPDEGCRYMDPISIKYTSAPFPSRGPDRVCFVIAAEKPDSTRLASSTTHADADAGPGMPAPAASGSRPLSERADPAKARPLASVSPLTGCGTFSQSFSDRPGRE